MFKVRNDEPDYAFIPDVEVPEQNQWGKNINTVDENSDLVGKSLNINDDDGVGENPNLVLTIVLVATHVNQPVVKKMICLHTSVTDRLVI